MPSPLARRLTQAMAEMPGNPTRTDLARAAGVSRPSVTDWYNGKTLRLGKALVPAARYLGVTPEWLNDGRLPKHPADASTLTRVGERAEPYASAFEIPLLDAPGSCGGRMGGIHMEDGTKVIKDSSWFTKHQVEPQHVVCVIADGDGNADYICHGDAVFFDTSRVKAESGVIYLVRHPDGLRIKRLRRDIDATWLIEYINQDKRRFPDERIAADSISMLDIVGRFIFREGG